MDITLAGGAAFPHFDRLVVLGQWIIILGFIAQLTIGVGRLFRGSAPEFMPAVVKTALAWWAITSLPMIGNGAFKYGSLLAEAIAGEEQMKSFLQSIEGILTSIYGDGYGVTDMFTLEFWLGLASTLCVAFAYISKYIVLEILWPLYLGLVIISGTFSISMATLPGLRTAQSWLLTLLEAVSWPMIFQILLGVVAAVTDQQVVVMEQMADGNIDFVPMLEGLATLCAVSFLTVMTPILAARLMRGEGASAAMSFVAAKAATMVSGLTARAAVAAVATPARAGANALSGGRAALPRRPGGSGGGGGGPIPPSTSPLAASAATGAGALGAQAGGAASLAAASSAARPGRRAVDGKKRDANERAAAGTREPSHSERSSTQQPEASGHTGSPTPQASTTATASQSGAASAVPNAPHPTPSSTAQSASPRAAAPLSGPTTPASVVPADATRVDAQPVGAHSPAERATAANTPAAGAAQVPHGSASEAQSTLSSQLSGAAPTPTPPAAGASQAQGDTRQGAQPTGNVASGGRAHATHGLSAHAASATASTTRDANTKQRETPASSKQESAPTGKSHSQSTTAQRSAPQPLDWEAPKRAAQQAQGAGAAAPQRRFYNIRGSTKEANAAIIAARKAGNPQRAQQIHGILKAHPATDTSSAGKATRRGLIRKAIQRLDEPSAPKGPRDA